MATLKMLAAGATEGPLTELVPEFSRASGHEVDLQFGTVGAQKDRFVGGEKADVLALSTVVLEALEKEGRFVPGSRIEFGRATCGVAIRDGFLMPDISTPEKFKAALLAARSVAQTDPAQGGSSGIYFAKLLERMGIAEEMKDKMRYGKAGRDVGMLVRELRAELGVTFTSEFIPIEGLRVVGNFPKEYEFVNAYGAAIPVGAAVEPARALLAFLTAPAAKATFKAYGLE
ncbi:MAG: ABC transporter substrate-binding protein [Alphaproteobacteria bacterium]|nr:ABC transporter substrate-binding protein [Alphaproteobacteria bacterium]